MPSPLPEHPDAAGQRPVGLAVVGLGVIGQRMLEQSAGLSALRIAGAWDIDRAACARARSAFPTLAIATDPASLIDDPDVDCVYIGTPPAVHRDYALMAAAAGKRVFCEKPLTARLDDARRLVDELAASASPNAVNFVFASAPGADWLQSRLAAADLGEIRSVEIRLFFARWPRDWQASADWLRLREQGGFVREVLSHFVYLTQRLFGECRLDGAQVSWPAQPERCEVAATATLSAAGIPVTVSAAAGGGGPDEVVYTVRGSHGALRLDNWYDTWESDGKAWREVSLPIAPHPDRRVAAYQAQLANLVRFVRGQSHPLPDAAMALRVQTLIEGLLAVR